MPTTSGDGRPFCFAVLGPVQVWRHGVELDIGARQQRLILALLLANAGQPVGIGDIVEALWDQRPPASAVNVVHRYIGALRRLFEPGLPTRSAGRWLLGDAAGYRMRVDTDSLDLLKLRQLTGQARADELAGRLTEAMSTYEDALSMWRGPTGGASELASYDRLAFSVVDHECADLARQATCLALRLDRVRSVLPVLWRLAEHRPLDEALQAQFLLALSADGQQAEAIALYQNIRRRLADELGVMPGDELSAAYHRILRQSVAGPESSGKAEPPPTAQPGRTLIGRASGLTAVLPAQLPADLPWFTGRDDAQRQTLGLVNSHVMTQASMPVLAIDGIPGIGKTALAIHLAHQLADSYPDGQLYVDLQGFDPDQSVLHPAEALQGFLNALGVPDTDIPASHHARSGLYRSVLAGRRILVVLDNAHSVEQVRPLLPGATGCLVLVTSRKRLTGLATAHGAHLMTLDVLPPEDARNCLILRIGADRTSAAPEAIDEIIERCGRLPLALAMVAARALAHPDHQLADIARELREAQGSLDAFSVDDMANDIRAIFSWSYRMLGARAARLFRLLSLHPGQDITVAAMASLAGVPLGEARLLAGELVRTGLLAEHTLGRFTSHDLIRAYAQELVHLHEDDQARQRAAERLGHHYRQTVYEADLLLTPTMVLDPPETLQGVVVTRLNDATEAVAWLNADRHVLSAVVQRQLDDGRVATAWRLAISLQRFHQGEGWWHDWAAMARACLLAATSAGDDLGQAHLSRSLAGAEHVLGNHDEAARLLRQSLDLFVGLGLRWEQALVYRNRGQVSVAQESHLDAVAHYERALRIFEALGDLSDQVIVLCCLADAHSCLGRPNVGMDLANRALPIARAMGDLNGQGLCYETLAKCFQAKGDLTASLASWRRAADIYQQTGWRMNSVECLLPQGDASLALGDPDGARAAWQQALELLSHLRVPQVSAIKERLRGLETARAVRVPGGRR
ncbi:BTAD domain-containing putative transcriptional regulator [Micromonospora sp. WMMD1082]|uniref:AfsR/SARP family transcriptional regulator n=1 Tax=Micromonospora sp. WMMD1082 TaxID=3016104 RepID=UPI002416FD6E|nr:BTAD domain-containing putative transcriptional regulator [Micromonospora sp. WMMD1082]MDG4795695.1 BTAD domain-containing putative transcriptional regulator [Micromonospora sp. WMMD1082]